MHKLDQIHESLAFKSSASKELNLNGSSSIHVEKPALLIAYYDLNN